MSAPIEDLYTALVAKGLNPEAAAMVESIVQRADAQELRAFGMLDLAGRQLAEVREREWRAAVLVWLLASIELGRLLVRLVGWLP